MLVISPRIWIGTKPATMATMTHGDDRGDVGRPEFGWTLLTPAGSSRSRLMEKKMRGWLMSMTSSTLVIPATAPAETRPAAQSLWMTASA